MEQPLLLLIIEFYPATCGDDSKMAKIAVPDNRLSFFKSGNALAIS
jgi:hypothetical protein